MVFLFFGVAFLASVIGAICGIGGGVIIKPVLDMLQMGEPDAIHFLSGCTVLLMSLYSVIHTMRAKDDRIETSIVTPLALGAALGGVAGKEVISAVRAFFGGSPAVVGIQAVALGFVTLATLLYTLNKSRIRTRNISNKALCALIGLLLGGLSSFLGIGGGPINLMVLSFLFGMDTKTAAANSLYVIFFSQSANLLAAIATGSVPAFGGGVLALMAAGGIFGGLAGRKLNRKMDNRAVDRLFAGLMVLIIGICLYNAILAFTA